MTSGIEWIQKTTGRPAAANLEAAYVLSEHPTSTSGLTDRTSRRTARAGRSRPRSPTQWNSTPASRRAAAISGIAATKLATTGVTRRGSCPWQNASTHRGTPPWYAKSRTTKRTRTGAAPPGGPASVMRSASGAIGPS